MECEQHARHYHKYLCMTPFYAKLVNMCEYSETKLPLLVTQVYAKRILTSLTVLIPSFIDEISQGVIQLSKLADNSINLTGGSWEFVVRLSHSDLTASDTFRDELELMQQTFNQHPLVNESTYKLLRAACSRNASQLSMQTEYLLPSSESDATKFRTETDFPVHGSFLPFIGTIG